jgi:hypothetical protein
VRRCVSAVSDRGGAGGRRPCRVLRVPQLSECGGRQRAYGMAAKEALGCLAMQRTRAMQRRARPSHAACTVGAVEVGRGAGLASQMEEAAALSRFRSLQQRLDHKLDRCASAGPVPVQMWQRKAQSWGRCASG